MKNKYYIDFETFKIDSFKESLKQREMIPSRVVLKENLDERFKILKKHGIKNVKNLIDALKNKQKVEEFAEKSTLPSDYLTVLKREAASFHPNPIALNKFPGIDSKALEDLAKAGYKNTKQLFTEAKTKGNTQDILNSSGVSKSKLAELVSLSDLARLYGVGPVFARMIYDVGIKSAEDFLKHTGDEFVAIYEKKTNKKADFNASDIDLSLELARKLVET